VWAEVTAAGRLTILFFIHFSALFAKPKRGQQQRRGQQGIKSSNAVQFAGWAGSPSTNLRPVSEKALEIWRKAHAARL